jgi:Zn-dependent M32 family carboxypeptidase
VSAQADTWREAPEEGDFNRLNRYGRLINRPCLAAPSEAVSAQADTWREAPEEGDFNRLNSYICRLCGLRAGRIA